MVGAHTHKKNSRHSTEVGALRQTYHENVRKAFSACCLSAGLSLLVCSRFEDVYFFSDSRGNVSQLFLLEK